MLFENILDFWILIMGMIYIGIVYKVYRFDSFLNSPSDELLSKIFWRNWIASNDIVSDHVFLMIIDFTYIIKALVQLRLLPVMGPVYAILKMLIKEMFIFGIFFFLQQFIFAVIGNLLFYNLPEYETLSEAMLTIFKASAGVFNKENMVFGVKE